MIERRSRLDDILDNGSRIDTFGIFSTGGW